MLGQSYRLMRSRFLVHVTLMMGLATLVLLACLGTSYRLQRLRGRPNAVRNQGVNAMAVSTPMEFGRLDGPPDRALANLTNWVPKEALPGQGGTDGPGGR